MFRKPSLVRLHPVLEVLELAQRFSLAALQRSNTVKSAENHHKPQVLKPDDFKQIHLPRKTASSVDTLKKHTRFDNFLSLEKRFSFEISELGTTRVRLQDSRPAARAVSSCSKLVQCKDCRGSESLSL